MSLRLRLLLAVTLVILAHAGARIMLLAEDARTSARLAQQAQGAWAGKSLAGILANPLVTNDLATVQSTVGLLFSEKYFLKLAVLDDRDKTIIDLRPDIGKIKTQAPAWFIAYLNLTQVPSTHVINIGGVQYGKIVTIVSPDAILESVWLEAQHDAWVALVEITVLSLLLWVLLEAGLRPLQQLSTTVQRIGAGDFSARMARTANREFSGLVTVVNAMAAKISALLDQTRAQAASEVQARRLQAFHAITDSYEEIDNKIQAVLMMAGDSLGMPYAVVGAVSKDTYTSVYVHRNATRTLQDTPPLLQLADREAMQHHDGVYGIHDAVEWTPPADRAETGIRSYIGAPIYIQAGIYGKLHFSSPAPRAAPFHLGDLEFVKLIAQWIGLELQQRRNDLALWEEKERALVTLASIGDAVITTDVDGNITYLNVVAESMTGWELRDAQSRPLTQVFHIVHEGTRAPAENPIEQCLRENRTVELAANTLLIRRDGSEFAIEDSAAPIKDRQGKIIGAVLVFHDVTQARVMLRQLEHYASHDQLTELPNRRLFESTLKLVLDSAHFGKKVHALCYLDLDQFKIVNDTCGHMGGDELLRQVTGLFKRRLRGTDVLARLGGDEFGLILTHITEDQARATAEEIRAMVREFRFNWQGKIFEIGVSIGLVMIDADAGETMDVLRRADTACYAAKNNGRNCVHMYKATDEEHTRLSAEMNWVPRLRQALREDRFALWYQPITAVTPSDGLGDYGEVLLRYVETNGDIILPGAFIPAAERYGLMPEIDRWVIQRTLGHAVQESRAEKVFHCAINLSGASLSDPGMLRFIQDALTRTGVAPDTLCFEITETAVVNHLANAVALITALRKLGCRFALDDFGTGLSSFSYLKHLPVDLIKIDGSFVSKLVDDPLDAAMVQAINHIGHVMGKKTVAEFVENDAILARLQAMGVDFAQGYGIGRPRPL